MRVRRFVVDLDLAKLFDRVNHDVLMARVARRVADFPILRPVVEEAPTKWGRIEVLCMADRQR